VLFKFESVDYVVSLAGAYLHQASNALVGTHVMMLEIYRNLTCSTKIAMELFKLLFSGNINEISLIDLLEY